MRRKAGPRKGAEKVRYLRTYFEKKEGHQKYKNVVEIMKERKGKKTEEGRIQKRTFFSYKERAKRSKGNPKGLPTDPHDQLTLIRIRNEKKSIEEKIRRMKCVQFEVQ